MKICITGLSTFPARRRSIQGNSSSILINTNSFFFQTKRQEEKGSFQGPYSLHFHLLKPNFHQLNNFASCKPQKPLEVLTKNYSCCDSHAEKAKVTNGHLQEEALSSQWLKPQCAFLSVFHSSPSPYHLFPLMSLSPTSCFCYKAASLHHVLTSCSCN